MALKKIVNGVTYDMTAEEEAELLEAAKHTAAIAEQNFIIQQRQQRDTLLTQSDWIVVKSMEAGESIPADWAAYRQALRDIPTQAGFPDNIEWPAKPE